MREVDGLLAEIWQASGCAYLSDLYANAKLLRGQAKDLVLAIPLARYPAECWVAAARYITGVQRSFASAEEARDAMLRAK